MVGKDKLRPHPAPAEGPCHAGDGVVGLRRGP